MYCVCFREFVLIFSYFQTEKKLLDRLIVVEHALWFVEQYESVTKGKILFLRSLIKTEFDCD